MFLEKRYSYTITFLLAALLVTLTSFTVWYIYSYRNSVEGEQPSMSLDWKEQFYLGEIVVGQDDAPVKVNYFFSLTCPACVRFHREVMPEINRKLIGNNMMQLTWIGLPTSDAAATLELLGRVTNSAAKYTALILYAYSGEPDKTSKHRFIQSVTNWSVKNGVVSRGQLAYLKKVGQKARDYLFEKKADLVSKNLIQGVPTLVVNGKVYKGEMTYAAIASYISKEYKALTTDLANSVTE